MFLKSILLLGFLIFSYSFASENLEKEDLKNITAKSRLDFVKKLLNENNDLKMTTPIGSCLYETLYQKDLEFILQEASYRQDGNRIKAELKSLDEVVEEHFKEKMSFLEYNIIAYHWTKILDYSLEDPRIPQLECSGQSMLLTSEYEIIWVDKKGSRRSYCFFLNHKDFGNAPYFLMPHTSKTGIVPILVINEGMGFWVEKGKKASAVHFLAVGTNKKQNFDHLRDQNPSDSWRHDLLHSEYLKYYQYPARLKKIASFKDVLREKVTDETEKKKYHLAFFDLFHESFESFDHIAEELKKKIEKFNKDKEKMCQYKDYFYPKDIVDAMMQTNIKNAKSLKIIITGNNCEEENKLFFEVLYEGHEILLKFADRYDSYKETF